MFYSKTTNGFYRLDIHGESIPADAVEITDDNHAALLVGQSAGLTIAADDTGRPALVAPPPPGAEQIRAQLIGAVQAHLDATANAAGYDNIFTASTYADEPAVPRFQAEGQALRAWRSQVWDRCHGVLAEVEAGRRGIPTTAELLAELPVLVM